MSAQEQPQSTNDSLKNNRKAPTLDNVTEQVVTQVTFFGRAPKMVLPTRTLVLPMRMASS
eukprot:2988778-Rhodomonas_salina.1